MPVSNVLLLTVGTGTKDQLEESLLIPLRKSIENGNWARIVLLPSKETAANAEAVSKANPSWPIVVRPLRKPGDEEDVDACFGHFERELAKLLEEGFAADSVIADFTRGTKAMSAALVLAAVVHGVRTLRYIVSPQRDQRGLVIAGSETPRNFRTANVTDRRDLERAMHLLRAGQFAAAERICSFPPPGILKNDFRWAAWAAQFWGAWDRLDYATAAALVDSPGLGRRPVWMREFAPGDAGARLLGRLKPPLPREPRNCVAPCRDLAADLLANAGRRLAERQTEEVLVRVYRVVELIGQYRLFSWGLDSGDLRLSADLNENLEAQGELLRPNHDGRVQIGREAVAKLLTVLGDPLAKDLLNLDWIGLFSVKARNRSVLIHGFRAKTRRDNFGHVETLLAQVENFYLRENDKNAVRLVAARFPFLTP